MWQYTTLNVEATAIAASAAVPPETSTDAPALVAAACGEVTAHRVPAAGGLEPFGRRRDSVFSGTWQNDRRSRRRARGFLVERFRIRLQEIGNAGDALRAYVIEMATSHRVCDIGSRSTGEIKRMARADKKSSDFERSNSGRGSLGGLPLRLNVENVERRCILVEQVDARRKTSRPLARLNEPSRRIDPVCEHRLRGRIESRGGLDRELLDRSSPEMARPIFEHEKIDDASAAGLVYAAVPERELLARDALEPGLRRRLGESGEPGQERQRGRFELDREFDALGLAGQAAALVLASAPTGTEVVPARPFHRGRVARRARRIPADVDIVSICF